MLLGIPFLPGFIYLYLAPYVVFLFLRVPTHYLNVAIIIITVSLSYSVCSDYISTSSGPAGIQEVYEDNLKLRPDVFKALSRTGGKYRAAGYTGSYHDSAHILGMAVSFFFISFILNRRLIHLGLFLCSMVSLTLTQSASNIIVAIATLLVFVGYILIRKKTLSVYLYFISGMVCILALIGMYGNDMSVFLERVSADGDWEGMAAGLGVDTLVSSIPFFIGGHAAGFGGDIMHVEVGLLGTIFELGIVYSVIFYGILLFPLLLFLKCKGVCFDALPALAAVVFGVLSLLHYGSLLRVTSVFLFYAFYVICLINIYSVKWPAYEKKAKYTAINLK